MSTFCLASVLFEQRIDLQEEHPAAAHEHEEQVPVVHLQHAVLQSQKPQKQNKQISKQS